MSINVKFVVICLGASLAVAGPSQPSELEKPTDGPVRNIGGPGDYTLRERLVGRLAKDPELSRADLRVVLVNGGAVFSGEISNCNLKRRALLVAADIRGIVNVTDLMHITAADLPDEALRQAIVDLLTDMKEGYGIQNLEVQVEDAVATLSGTVRDFASRVRVEEVVGTVAGLTRISNHLQPRDAPSGSDDASLLDAVIEYLGDFRRYSHSGEIEVEVERGVVTLWGRVPTYLARQQAAVMAALVGGVRSVEVRLEADPSVPVMRSATITARR